MVDSRFFRWGVHADYAGLEEGPRDEHRPVRLFLVTDWILGR
jgi:hypothetical protein